MNMKIVTFRIRKIRALNTDYALTQANVLTQTNSLTLAICCLNTGYAPSQFDAVTRANALTPLTMMNQSTTPDSTDKRFEGMHPEVKSEMTPQLEVLV